MIIASCRRSFDSNEFVARHVAFRRYTAAPGGTTFTPFDNDAVLKAATNRHVCILVHGYNNDLSSVLKAYREMAIRMRSQGVVGPDGYGLVMGFTWPGRANKARFMTARGTAMRSGPHLRQLINSIRSVAFSVDVQTHSLGARVALSALMKPREVFVDQLLLSGPAVDSNILEPGKRFHPALSACNRCFVYHSTYDQVLRKAYPLGDWADGWKTALALRGPRSKRVTLTKCPNLHVIDCSPLRLNHGDYRESDNYIQHWHRVLSGDAIARYEVIQPA